MEHFSFSLLFILCDFPFSKAAHFWLVQNQKKKASLWMFSEELKGHFYPAGVIDQTRLF